jgi:pyruvate/2-oxoglutarate dehydrogenase complex dihydrolipoamide acyltransferase (E2) component
MRVEVPNSDPSLRGGTIKTWHKTEGEFVNFGEEICTLAYSDFAVLRRTGRASLLAGRKRRKIKGGLESRDGMVLVDVILTSSDPGVLQKIFKTEGEEFLVGDVIGVVTTSDSSEAVGEDWHEYPPIRLIANMATGTEQY